MQDEELTVEKLRARVAEERRRAGERRALFSEELKRDGARFALAVGGSIDGCAETLGVSRTAMHHWVKCERQRRETETTAAGGRLFEAQIVGEPMDGLVLRFPSGARVTGLTLEQLRSLVVDR